MRHIAWAVTWIVVGLATTLATANVLMQSAELRRKAAPAAEPSMPTAEPAGKPIAKVRPPTEHGRSVIAVGYKRDRN
jgi:hypothetical protein